MAREGTRSQTGHSKPRVFATVDTEPAVKRTTKPKTVKKPAAAAKTTGGKPAGVTKQKAAPKNESGVAKKAKSAVKKTKAKADKVGKEAKADIRPKATKKSTTTAPTTTPAITAE